MEECKNALVLERGRFAKKGIWKMVSISEESGFDRCGDKIMNTPLRDEGLVDHRDGNPSRSGSEGASHYM